MVPSCHMFVSLCKEITQCSIDAHEFVRHVLSCVVCVCARPHRPSCYPGPSSVLASPLLFGQLSDKWCVGLRYSMHRWMGYAARTMESHTSSCARKSTKPTTKQTESKLSAHREQHTGTNQEQGQANRTANQAMPTAHQVRAVENSADEWPQAELKRCIMASSSSKKTSAAPLFW